MKKILKPLSYALLVVYSLISIYPIVWLVLYSFKDNEEIFSTNPYGLPFVWRYENYIRAMTEFDLPLYFRNSIIVTVTSVVIGIAFALLFGYAVTRMRFKISNKLRFFVVLGMFLPVQVYVIPLILQIKSFGLSDSLLSVIVPYIAMGLPFSTLVLYGAYSSMPMELEESACIDGASIYQTFFHIILPLMKPTISALVIYKAMNAWNEYTLAMLVLQNPALKTLPLGLATFVGEISTEWGPIGATLVIASAPILVLYIAFSDRIEEAMSMNSGTKG